jgi:hypothetical protein
MPGLDVKEINAKILPAPKALKLAKDIVVKVRGLLDIGASNQPSSGPAQKACVPRMRKFANQNIQFSGSFFWTVGDLREIADRAIRSRCGNCGENAAIAFISCVDQKVEPLDYMECAGPGDDHVFLVIGRKEGSSADRYDAATWGPDAVVCDPWMNKAYLCSEMSIHLAPRTSTFTYRSTCRYRTIAGMAPH